MVTDRQVRTLRKLMQSEATLAVAAAKAGMDEKTARRYLQLGQLPSECKVPRTWRTRSDPFAEVWEEVLGFLEGNAGLQSLTLFDYLQRQYPGRFEEGQLRTLQRRVKHWRAVAGPAREVYFAQVHRPGELSQSDFTHMSPLGVTIAGRPFDHLVYHFVLTYSNWETGTICFSESFESLSEGLQNALWELGGVPGAHRTDRLSSAVHQMPSAEEFTRRYRGLLAHYQVEPRTIQTGKANENGDVEQSHHRFKVAVDQALMLRGSRDFAARDEYAGFLAEVMRQRNSGRRRRFEEELGVLRRLPLRRVDTSRRLRVRVGPSSTIRVVHNVYSVHSRLIGEQVDVQLRSEELEIWYGQRRVDQFPRLRGEGKHRIDYRHVIDWLVRKPGAFENYRYREDLFPSSCFRMAYDALQEQQPARAAREYIGILALAASESEERVGKALRLLIAGGGPVTVDAVEEHLSSDAGAPMTEVHIEPVDLRCYDRLLGEAAEETRCVAVVS
jgi:transposase